MSALLLMTSFTHIQKCEHSHHPLFSCAHFHHLNIIPFSRIDIFGKIANIKIAFTITGTEFNTEFLLPQKNVIKRYPKPNTHFRALKKCNCRKVMQQQTNSYQLLYFYMYFNRVFIAKTKLVLIHVLCTKTTMSFTFCARRACRFALKTRVK